MLTHVSLLLARAILLLVLDSHAANIDGDIVAFIEITPTCGRWISARAVPINCLC